MKRLFDLAVAVPSVIILSPVLVLIGIPVRLKSGRGCMADLLSFINFAP
jgi:lipopolysaccharide/colanic/teichoic acid biosynthesis glycosyltransferase